MLDLESFSPLKCTSQLWATILPEATSPLILGISWVEDPLLSDGTMPESTHFLWILSGHGILLRSLPAFLGRRVRQRHPRRYLQVDGLLRRHHRGPIAAEVVEWVRDGVADACCIMLHHLFGSAGAFRESDERSRKLAFEHDLSKGLLSSR